MPSNTGADEGRPREEAGRTGSAGTAVGQGAAESVTIIDPAAHPTPGAPVPTHRWRIARIPGAFLDAHPNTCLLTQHLTGHDEPFGTAVPERSRSWPPL